MSAGLLVGGVIVSPIAAACAAALAMTMALSAALARFGFYRLVWHRPLVEAAIFCLALAAVTLAPGVGVGR